MSRENKKKQEKTNVERNPFPQEVSICLSFPTFEVNPIRH